MRQWWPWCVIAVVFVVFCCAFNGNTPYRKAGILMHQKGPDGLRAQVQDVGAPDERQHANYVARLMNGQGFPVLKPGDPDLYESYQSHQPPLYYLLAAGWCKLTGSDPLSQSGFMPRALNTLIGVATLLAIGLGAWWGFGKKSLALAAPAIVLMPMSVALHSAVTNDPLLFCLCSWTLALIALALRSGWTLKACALIGLTTGLAFLTKTPSLALAPVIAVALLLSLREKETRPSWKAGAALVGIPILLAGGWWLRNMGLYGDPFAMGAFKSAFTGSPQAQMFIDGFGASEYWLNWVLWWTARSYIGTFGYSDIFMFESMGAAKAAQLAVSCLLVLSILKLMALASWPSFKEDRPAKVFVGLFMLFALEMVVFFVGFNRQYFQGQARYLYPAIAPAGWVIGAGLCVLMGRHRPWAWAVLLAAFAALDVSALNEIAAGFAVRVVP